jgi:hypothetical protein
MVGDNRYSNLFTTLDKDHNILDNDVIRFLVFNFQIAPAYNCITLKPLLTSTCVADPEISKTGGGLPKGGGDPTPRNWKKRNWEKKSCILGLKFRVLLTLDGKFWAKREGGGLASL